MSKTLLYRLFRIGRLPREQRARLEAEGLCCIDEGVSIAMSWRRYREPGRYIARRRQNATGSVALTQRRLFLYVFSQPLLDLDLADPAADRLAVDRPAPETLSISLNAEDFRPGCSGQMTCWLSTPQAELLFDLWQQRRTVSSRRGADGLEHESP